MTYNDSKFINRYWTYIISFIIYCLKESNNFYSCFLRFFNSVLWILKKYLILALLVRTQVFLRFEHELSDVLLHLKHCNILHLNALKRVYFALRPNILVFENRSLSIDFSGLNKSSNYRTECVFAAIFKRRSTPPWMISNHITSKRKKGYDCSSWFLLLFEYFEWNSAWKFAHVCTIKVLIYYLPTCIYWA